MRCMETSRITCARRLFNFFWCNCCIPFFLWFCAIDFYYGQILLFGHKLSNRTITSEQCWHIFKVVCGKKYWMQLAQVVHFVSFFFIFPDFFLTHNGFLIGKWHKNCFTNGDVVDLLTAMSRSECAIDQRELLYSIVMSGCPNCTMKKYRLYEKALKVKMEAEPRKSRRRRSSSNRLPGTRRM